MIPAEEVWRRLARFRELTPDSLRIVHGRSNVRYLTGYEGGGFTPWMIISDQAVVIVFYTADEDSIASYSTLQLELRPFGPRDDVLATVRSAATSIRGGPLTGDTQWWAIAEGKGIGLEIADCSDALRTLRAVKSEWEQARLREAGRITQATMDRLEQLAEEGASARELGASLYETAISLGSSPFTYIPYIALGKATFENHTTWDWNRLTGQDEDEARGGPYLFEFATSVEGYGTPLTRSWSDDADAQRALKAVERGIEAIRAELRPEADAADLHRLMQSSIEQEGFSFSHRAGYSIGLGEAETWMEGNVALLGPLAQYSIRAGMAFHVVGSVVLQSRFGVARSNSILVTTDGLEVIAA